LVSADRIRKFPEYGENQHQFFSQHAEKAIPIGGLSEGT